MHMINNKSTVGMIYLDEERKEAVVYEGRESLKTWANIAKRLTNEKTIEQLEKGKRSDNEEE